jgi:hypothetical protein
VPALIAKWATAGRLRSRDAEYPTWRPASSQSMPLESLTDPDQCERLRDTLQPGQPVNFAITIEVVLVDELGVGRRQLF